MWKLTQNFSFFCWELQSCFNVYWYMQIFCMILVFHCNNIILALSSPTSLTYLHAEPIFNICWSPIVFLSVEPHLTHKTHKKNQTFHCNFDFNNALRPNLNTTYYNLCFWTGVRFLGSGTEQNISQTWIPS